ncbi:hypothetical protein AAF712_011903 [Marasmius tenuissimus]|uniref:Uncharacterized protein n=1 Tax=Marasmius tenuissimus TaxID=585030 RepID=A0ABR2ZIX3_9AGAR
MAFILVVLATFLVYKTHPSPGNCSKAHYTPLHHQHGSSYNPLHLPLWNHKELTHQAEQVTSAPTDTKKACKAKEFGINGLLILARLSSVSFPESFPHDLMHIGLKNMFQTSVSLWTSTYKGLDSSEEVYELQPTVVKAIGDACIQAGDMTPLAFGAQVPDIAKEEHYFTAETWTLFTAILGPILLHNCFEKQCYYHHFIDLIKLLNRCISISISKAEVKDDLRRAFAKWVQKIEQCVI